MGQLFKWNASGIIVALIPAAIVASYWQQCLKQRLLKRYYDGDVTQSALPIIAAFAVGALQVWYR